MTTLSKEDVVRWADVSFSSDFIDYMTRAFVAARADLVAENEQLKLQLKAQTDEWHKAYDLGVTAKQQLTATRAALAAAEADNERLRKVVTANHEWHKLYDIYEGYIESDLASMNSGALAQPRDDSALREMIAGVYDECAKLFSEHGASAVIAIRALAEKAKGE